MTSDDHNQYLEWLFLESDEQLTASERGRLRQHLESCASCNDEAKSIAAMNIQINSSLVTVRQGFRDEVMAGLQPAGWEAKSPRTWAAAAILVLMLLGGAVLMTGSTVDGNPAFGPIAAATRAVADFLQSSLLAGAGLLSASWRGLGLAFSSVLSESRWTAASFIVLVVGLDLLLFRLLLRPKRRRRDSAAVRSDSNLRSK